METPIVNPTPESTGSPEGTGSQATELTSQEGIQQQPDSQRQVETPGQSTSSQGEGRPVSRFYQERQENKKLKAQVDDISKKYEDMSKKFEEMLAKANTPPPVVPQPVVMTDAEKQALYADPPAYLSKRFEKMMEDMQKQVQSSKEEIYKNVREKEIPTVLSETHKLQEQKRNEQEALELLFPKTNKSNESLEDRVKNDPQRVMEIEQIMREKKLDVLSLYDPKSAAELTLTLLNTRRSQKTPLAPSKAAMASTASGTPLGGGSKVPTLQDAQANFDRLTDLASKNPDLMRDPKFVEEWNLAQTAFVQLHKELVGK